MANYEVSKEQKEEIKQKITFLLKGREEINFAYLHGSFLEDNFRDIDIAIYLTRRNKRAVLQYELDLENELNDLVDFPVDARILNYAPLPFRFNVIKNGVLLFSRDEGVRCDFECLSIVEYHDFDFLRRIYRKEALGIPSQSKRR